MSPPEPTTGRRGPTPSWLGVVEVLTAGALLVAFVLPLARRSINLSDEGYLLLQALDMLQGKVLYRDMDAFVSPGIWFLLSGLFSVVEPSVLASRSLILAAFVCMVGVAHRIVSFFCPPRWALACALLFVVFVVWAFPIWTFTFYSPFAVLFSLIALERLLVWDRGAKPRDLALCGAAFGLAVIFKQNYGAFALFGGLLGLLALRLARRADGSSLPRRLAGDLGLLSAGGIAVALPFFVYFARHGALGDVFQSLVIHPFVFAGQHSVAYLSPAGLFEPDLLSGVDRLTYGAYSLYNTAIPTEWLKTTRLIERLHVLLYQLPPLVLGAGALYCVLPIGRGPEPGRARFDARLFALWSVCAALFLGVFPRADYNHLINLYQPILILGVIVVHRTSSALPARLRHALLTLVCLLFLAYASVAALWYREHLVHMDTLLEVRRGGVLVRPEVALRLNTLIEIVWKSTDERESLLTVPDLSMLNFLAERDMPSPYYNLYQHHIEHDGGAGVVEGSQAKGVRLAITNYSDFFSDRVRLRHYAPALTDYLDRFFRIRFSASGDNFLILERRSEPLPERERLRVLEACELGATGDAAEEPDHFIQPHLLFSTLYQDRGARHDDTHVIVESRCRIRVPEDADELSVRVGLRPPLAAQPRASLLAQLFVEHAGAREQLLARRFAVFHPYGLQLVRRWPEEDRIPIGHLAGQEVTFVFRSERRGWVKRDPYSYKGYSTMWIGPRIVSTPAE